MNKQELIDKAVKKFSGIWGDSRNNLICAGNSNILHEPFNYFSYSSQGLGSRDEKYWVYVCTKEEFLEHAKALGFVEQTGYRYGVEYETEGKKPKLPYDILVEVKYNNEWQNWEEEFNAVENWNWDTSQAFHIVDERYKPTTTEVPLKYPVSTTEATPEAWFDVETGVGVSYPPQGAKCEVFDQGEWRETYIVGFDSEGDAVFETPWEDSHTYDSYYNGYKYFRPLGWDEERKVEAKAKAVADSLNSTGGHKVFTIAEMNLLKLLVREGKIK